MNPTDFSSDPSDRWSFFREKPLNLEICDNWDESISMGPLIEDAISRGTWTYITLLLKKYPNALSESFNRVLEEDNYSLGKDQAAPLHFTVMQQDENLVLDILSNKRHAITSNFVVNLIGDMAFMQPEPRWAFIENILKCCPEVDFSAFVQRKFIYALKGCHWERPVLNPNLILAVQNGVPQELHLRLFEHALWNNAVNDHQINEFLGAAHCFNSDVLAEKVLIMPSGVGVGPVLKRLLNYEYPEKDVVHFLEVILEMPSQFFESKLPDMLNLTYRYRLRALMLRIFRSHSTINLEDFFVGTSPEALSEYFQIARELEYVNRLFKENIQYLLNRCSDCFFFDEELQQADNILNEILRLFPEVDLSEYTEKIIDEYPSPNAEGHFKAIQRQFKILVQHARSQNQVDYLAKYGWLEKVDNPHMLPKH